MADSTGAYPWRRTDAGVLVAVRLTPKSSGEAIEGVETHDGRPVLKARVRAVPEKGRANAALEGLMAKWLGIPRSRVSVVTGSTSRLKSVALSDDADALIAILKQKTGAHS